VGVAFARYLRGELRAIPSRTTYCWGHVDDIAAVHLAAMERGAQGATYIVAGPARRLDEVFAEAARITGIRAPRRVPAVLLRLAAACMRPVGALVALPPQLHPESLRVLSGVTYLGDDRKAREQLGFHPRPLAEGLRDALGSE
jgi:nucleoside-diphosphate-sugar epimerase